MLKLTKTGIGLLTKQYRSVLRKCWAINEGLFWATIFPMIITSNISFAQSSVAIGSGADAYGAYSVAIGNLAKAVGYASFALAPSAKTEARESVAIGNRSFTSAEADKSVALGYNSVANEGFVISVGHTATDINYENGSAYGSNLFRRIVNVAEGSGANDAVTVSQLGNIAAGTKILNANGESAITFGTGSGQTTIGTAISTLANQLYNYYYTFRVDERTEAIEFAEELRSDKKEMSSLDFMPIKSSSDLRINLIKAEDPLTFSAKTRDDSLVLMEVCHA